MSGSESSYEIRFAANDADIKAAQRLRYRVFVQELGSDGPMVDHEQELEADAFDPFYDHLMLIDPKRSDDPLEQCIGVYRLLSGDKRDKIGKFYTEDEFDITPLMQSGKRLLELGRSCVAKEYRGGSALYHMWSGLASYVFSEGFDILFGTASFHGTDIDQIREPLALLHHRHIAPEELRVTAHSNSSHSMSLMPFEKIDLAQALQSIPPLIKAYLRMGGTVGEGAYIDHAFNTIDVCLILDVENVPPRQRQLYTTNRRQRS